MHNAAEEYGRALFDLAAEGDGDVIERDAKAVLAAFTAAPEYIRLLENPGIPEEKRRTALTRAVAETTGLYALVIAILLIFVAPHTLLKVWQKFVDANPGV